ncbi:TPA: hypothetical protein N5L20_002911 [Enterobacter kobei]|jgi:hypothetical protein|uniref:Uncharacterized protein n=2 Tax=Enterobacter kobei TaxID=208224 RepID=A0ABX9EXT4_9ENTR|nr:MULTISPECIES: hypothetical protein [Enterobacter]CAE7613913.1 hypothetical protein AI2762V1_2701 [Enterobacter cloacae]EKS6745594.1 hypothetical protein [Enterobacter kobei]EKV5789979.1 hypothetical protein [Enterobacter kobei]EKY1590807.1 hypothetical protein [Enterobacter kobei]ELE6988361.1 hypothetical protein [Enterobacter kobei]
MINLNFNAKTGKLIFDGLTLEIDTEEGFCNSKLYHKLNTFNAVKKYMPYHYLIDPVFFCDKEFEINIRPICFGFPFMVHLVDKDSEYYKSLKDWDARTNINMLNNSVKSLSDWLSLSLNLGAPDITKTEMIRWDYEWGRISVSYETKSFNHGIHIVWNSI